MKKVIALLLLTSMFLLACGGSAYDQEADDVELAQAQLSKAQPVVTYDYSLERSIVQQIYDARMEGYVTYSYAIDLYDGHKSWGCTSKGMPIPYATQLTNPEVSDYLGSGGAVTLPQPEPNGLYTPDSADATLVLCYGEDGELVPVYEERAVSTYFVPQCFEELQRTDGSWTGKWEQSDCGAASFTIAENSLER